MNKYELAVVVNAKLEDEERAATIEKVKEYITRFGGTVTDVDTGVREDLLTRSRRCAKVSTTSFTSRLMEHARRKWKDASALWKMSSDIYALDRMHR